eukprot:CAMPEP_0202962626 /NCGR_PEP_ID=MMETSP1396-20130829/6734_1 /ASSEMBLY_ACC=CAM_ASM_000872 /TAXON_ID= /ORGANISM="Pseudokeronopsis sp., Strain Brazil" /LENGTH=134 /DNA_ID=CAMNT_0049683349 /DNA_START=106 /DNA_END=510 /DNA_ORIENTATION=+
MYDPETERNNRIYMARERKNPFNLNDFYRMRLELDYDALENLNDACYDVCTDSKFGTHFLTYGEGICFRNCIQKFGQLFEPLADSLQSSDFAFYEKKIVKHITKDPEVKKFYSDPWEHGKGLFTLYTPDWKNAQ